VLICKFNPLLLSKEPGEFIPPYGRRLVVGDGVVVLQRLLCLVPTLPASPRPTSSWSRPVRLLGGREMSLFASVWLGRRASASKLSRISMPAVCSKTAATLRARHLPGGPDQQSNPAGPVKTAMDARQNALLAGNKAEHFARGELRNYGNLSPPAQSSEPSAWISVPKAVPAPRQPAPVRLLCHRRSKALRLDVGSGTAANRFTVMSRISLATKPRRPVQQMPRDIGGSVLDTLQSSHLLRPRFEDWSLRSATPRAMHQDMAREAWLDRADGNAITALPISDLRQEECTGSSRSRNFHSHTGQPAYLRITEPAVLRS